MYTLLTEGSIHHKAPVTGGGTDELEQSTERTTMKWARMWRSLILSSLGNTLFPYSQYIRELRLQNLHELLTDSKFLQKTRIHGSFFAGELTSYRVDRPVESSKKKRTYLVIDAEATLNRFAKDLMLQTPMLEVLSCPTVSFDSKTLAESIPLLPNLQSLAVFFGEMLAGMGNLFYKHCPHLQSLEIYGWTDPQADQDCANLISQLRPQSLRTLRMRSMGDCRAETLLALNNHGDSLETMEIEAIHADAMPALSVLKGCTKIKSLGLAEAPPPSQDLEKRHNDTFLEVIAWLRECKSLRSVAFKNLLSGSALLMPILLENDIKLVSLSLDGCVMAESRDFCQALVHQPNLQTLSLSGEGYDPGDAENDLLVEALSKLQHLTHLYLKEVSDGFMNTHIVRLVQELPQLEDFGISGYGVDDGIWEDMASLHSLHRLELNAISRFTANGILDFIMNLGEGNRGLQLSINMQENESEISDQEHAIIQDTLSAKLEGRFGLTFWKGSCSFDPG